MTRANETGKRSFVASRPRIRYFLASLELLVRLLFKRVLYSRSSYNSENTVFNFVVPQGAKKIPAKVQMKSPIY